MIRLLALDIDGVITDGRVMLDAEGHETKAISYRDIDAIFAAKRQGLQVALVTAEDTPWVDMIARRLEVALVRRGAKDKVRALQALALEAGVAGEEICFVGDSSRDAAAFTQVGLALAPADGAPEACAAAHRVLRCGGGAGAVAEAVEMVLSEAVGAARPVRT